jgi:hypothetical protein
MNERDARIVKRSRLYRLLADRPEYLTGDRERRFTALDGKVAVFVSPIDAESVEDATDLDRLCGAAVARLRRRNDAGVVDLLGWLGEDRLAAVALALSDDRRDAVVGSDPVWARAWVTVDMDAVHEVETLIGDLDAAWKAYDDHLRLLVGSPEDVTDLARRLVAERPSEA